MKQVIITSVFCLFVAISCFAQFSGGNGTQTNPYLISSKADMELLATNVNSRQAYAGVYFRLTRDLTEAADTLTTIVRKQGLLLTPTKRDASSNPQFIFGTLR